MNSDRTNNVRLHEHKLRDYVIEMNLIMYIACGYRSA